jgi:rhodanese-related sulfurtransferase
MKIQIFILIGTFLFKFLGCGAQVPANRAHCTNPAFDKHVAFYLSFTIPTIDPNGLKKLPPQTVILDAREKNEYEVSHIPNATHCGYNQFDIQKWQHLVKNQPIVVYCSIGYRSEKIAEKLKKAGFTQVYNLYGSIFEWVNQGNSVVDAQEKPTKKVHTFNKSWSQWVQADKAERIW